MIAAIAEPEHGVYNLWKCGEGRGRHEHADFGRCIPKNTFKAFLASVPHAFAPKELWYKENQDLDWEFFLLVVQSLNKKRQALFKMVLLVLDKSMSVGRPKTTKTGPLQVPNNS